MTISSNWRKIPSISHELNRNSSTQGVCFRKDHYPLTHPLLKKKHQVGVLCWKSSSTILLGYMEINKRKFNRGNYCTFLHKKSNQFYRFETLQHSTGDWKRCFFNIGVSLKNQTIFLRWFDCLPYWVFPYFFMFNSSSSPRPILDCKIYEWKFWKFQNFQKANLKN